MAQVVRSPRRVAGRSPQTITSESETLLRALADQHPRYKEFNSRWQQYIDCYEGENLSRYMFRHLRESEESIKKRRERLYYLNFCQPVVDLYTHYIFSKPPVRKESAEEVLYARSFEGDILSSKELAGGYGELGGLPPSEEMSEWRMWMKDVDRQGNSIDRFMADTSRYAFIFGHVYIVVDMPYVEAGSIATEQDRLNTGMRPYLAYYFPLDVPDFGVDDENRLVWIRFREPLPDKTDPFEIRDKIKKQKSEFVRTNVGLQKTPSSVVPEDAIYRTWTRDSWFVHKVEEGNVELVRKGSHGLGEVPVVPLYHKRHSRFPAFGTSLLSDIARINVIISNWCSLIDEEIFQKTLNILCLQKGHDDKQEVVIGSDNVLEWEGGQAPFFLAPSTDPGSFISAMIEKMRDEIYRLAKLGGGLGLTTPQRTPSGIAQAFEFNETNRVLIERADEIERAENEVHRLWHKWLGLEWQGLVDYPEDFSVESFNDELDVALKAKQNVRSPTFKREVEKKLVRKMMQNVNPVLLNAIGVEIDILPELVIGPFGPMYFTPEQEPQATPTTSREISRSPLQEGGEEEDAALLQAQEREAQQQEAPPEAKGEGRPGGRNRRRQAQREKARGKMAKTATGTPQETRR